MGSRRRWIGFGIVLLAGATAILAFRGRTGGGEVRPGLAPVASTGVAPDPASPGSWHSRDRPGTEAGAPPVPARDGTETVIDPVPTDAERAEAEHLAASLRKLVSDLEYSPGLPEPSQQTVLPLPEPWRPDPGREGPPPVIEEVAPLRVRTGGGDRVTIRGRNLRVVEVMFGITPARLLAASGTLVAVEAPPSRAGPVTVAVTNDDGTWALAGAPVVYAE